MSLGASNGLTIAIFLYLTLRFELRGVFSEMRSASQLTLRSVSTSRKLCSRRKSLLATYSQSVLAWCLCSLALAIVLARPAQARLQTFQISKGKLAPHHAAITALLPFVCAGRTR